MDARGIDMHVVFTGPVFMSTWWADAQTALALTRRMNRIVADWVRRYPTRFIGSATLPMQDIALAAGELKRCVDEHGHKAVMLPTNVDGAYLGERKFWPLWETIRALDLAVFIHPEGLRDPWYHRFALWNSLGQSIEEARVMASMIYEGLMDAIPGLKVVVARMAAAISRPIWDGPTATSSSRRRSHQHQGQPPDYLRHFYYDTCVLCDALALEMLFSPRGRGPDRARRRLIRSATSIRSGLIKQARDLAGAIAELAMVAAGTAARLLGIAVPRSRPTKSPRRGSRQRRIATELALASHDIPIGTLPGEPRPAQAERSREILRQIVESYLATAKPVGSRNISRLITMPLSPASVRNVMSDLEQLGLVYAPHTSAGRLPTELGLRFFIDALMEIGDVSEGERRDMEAKIAASGKLLGGGAQARRPACCRGPDPFGRGRAHHQVQRPPQAYRVRSAGARALSGGAGRRGRAGREPHPRRAGRAARLLAHGGGQLPQRPWPRPHPTRGQGGVLEAMEAGKAALDRLTQKVVEAGLASWSGDERRPPAHRPRPCQSARRSQGTSRIWSAWWLLFDDLETKRGVIDMLGRGRAGRGGAHLHRLREQAVLALGLLHHRGALPRRRRPHHRGDRGDRPDPAELCAGHPAGGLHRQGGEQAGRGLIRPCRLDFYRRSPDMRGQSP